MKALRLRKTYLILIAILAIALFTPTFAVYAEETAPPAETPPEEQPTVAPAVGEGSATIQALGGGEMVTLDGGALPPPSSPSAVSPSAIGGAFSSLMSESFKTDLATGTATLSIPIVVPPGRKNVQPNLGLSYSSTNPNGICGMGWSLPVSAIQRSTKKGVPRYDSLEDFTAGGEELVKISENADECEYLAKIESSFTKYTYYKIDKKWIACDKGGTQYYFGSTEASRVVNPANTNYIFTWCLDKVVDIYGNTMTFTYKYIDTDEGKYLYPDYIDYTGSEHGLSPDKRVEFVYEAAERPDKIHNHRAGWPLVIKRRLEKIKISVASNVVWVYNLNYIKSKDTSRSLLKSIQLEDSAGKKLPAKQFRYQVLEP